MRLGADHINGIEGFWSYAEKWLHGTTFPNGVYIYYSLIYYSLVLNILVSLQMTGHAAYLLPVAVATYTLGYLSWVLIEQPIL